MSETLQIVQIGDLIKTKNDKSKQLQSNDYRSNGVLPVVDQGAKLVCGYTNDLSKRYDKGLPVIIFGDHTLHTKFIDFNFAIGADGTQVVAPKHQDCDTKYLYYLISRAANLIGSEGYKRHFKILKEFDIEYIEHLPEQQKIAAILSSVDDVIEKTRAQIDKLKDLKTGMMQELLTKGIGHTAFKDSPVGRIPEGWEVVPLEELCSKISVGIASSTTHAYVDRGVPILRNQNILEGSIRPTDMLHISHQFSDENSSKKIREGDVLTVRTGYPGVSAVVPKEFDGCHSFTTLISRPKKRDLKPEYLALLINSDYGKHFVVGGQAGGAQQNLNATILKTFPVILPSLEEQAAIFDMVNSVSTKIVCIEKKYRSLLSIKKALMQDLLTGKVRVNVDNKENAVA